MQFFSGWEMDKIKEAFRENQNMKLTASIDESFMEKGYAGIRENRLVPLAFPDHVQKIPENSPLFAQGYRYTVLAKTLPHETMTEIMNHSIQKMLEGNQQVELFQLDK